jgi:protein JSN1
MFDSFLIEISVYQVVQKLFERCSTAPRFAMLERITPHLAMIGIHKNGTWAAQKIIECVQSPEEVALIGQNLRPYAPPLLLDQFGNYVVQYVLYIHHLTTSY